MGGNVLNILNSICDGWVYELKFDSARKFKFDFGNLRLKIAIEMEGGIYQGTGHAKTGPYLKDMEKYNLAQIRGWMVLRYAYGQEDKIHNDVIRAIEKRRKDINFQEDIEKVFNIERLKGII